jgi:hypothetical protein
MIRLSSAPTWICFALLFITTSGTLAEDSAYRKRLNEVSLSEGFSHPEINTLSIVVTTERKGQAERSIDLAKSGKFGKLLGLSFETPTQDGRKTMSFVSEQGYLQVYADGSRFKLRGDIDKVTPVETNGGKEKVELGRLEQLGREFIKGALSPLVQLQTNENLTFLGARYLRQGGANVKDAKAKEFLVANIAIFGREVNGLPIVGSGSKIAVWFTPEEKVIGIDVDWPQYKANEKMEKLLPKDELRQRIEAASVPLSGTQNVKVRRLECGYVDLGATRRNAATPIQPGCAIAFQGFAENGDGTTYGRLEFVPAAKVVYSDEHWPLATQLARGGEAKPGIVNVTPGAEPAPNDPWSDAPQPAK